MTSIYRPLIKFLFISLTLTVGIAFSAFSSVKQYQATLSQQTNNVSDANNHLKKQITYKPKSEYERQLQRDIDRLIPGNKRFDPRFLRHVLANSKKHKE